MAHQEYNALKKFGDSLLSKNKKLSDLSGQLDEAMAASDETSPHQDRVTKCFIQIESLFIGISTAYCNFRVATSSTLPLLISFAMCSGPSRTWSKQWRSWRRSLRQWNRPSPKLAGFKVENFLSRRQSRCLSTNLF